MVCKLKDMQLQEHQSDERKSVKSAQCKTVEQNEEYMMDFQLIYIILLQN